MRDAHNIDELVKNTLKTSASPELDRRIDSLIAQADEKQTQTSNKWRITMNNKTRKLAVAAAVLVAIVLSITFFDSTTQQAYAIEQSIEASHTVQTLHIRFLKSAWQFDFDDVYMKYDQSGKLESARLEAAQSPDGPKTIVWNNDVAKVWMKAKNAVLVVREPRMASQMEEMATELDPKQTLQNLYEMQQNGEQDVKIIEPEQEGGLITIEIVYGERREIYYVDPESKLLVRFEKQTLKGQDYVVLDAMEISGYNEPIDENMFTLGDLPEDVFVLDQANREIGLVQGDLTDDEVVAEAARQFFQALIDEDYAKAGMLMEGLPAARLELMFHGLKFIRIISVGKVVPHSNPRTRGLSIPCDIEIISNGQTAVQTFNLGIRKVHGREDRWTIFGGI